MVISSPFDLHTPARRSFKGLLSVNKNYMLIIFIIHLSHPPTTSC